MHAACVSDSILLDFITLIAFDRRAQVPKFQIFVKIKTVKTGPDVKIGWKHTGKTAQSLCRELL